MQIAGGLGQTRVLDGVWTVPSVANITFDEDDLIVLSLAAAAIIDDLHPTAPIKHVAAGGRSFFLNGIDRIRKYSGGTARNAYVLAPVRPPSITEPSVPVETLDTPYDVCVYGSWAFIVDYNNDRIVQVDLGTGAFIATYGENGSGSGQLDAPYGITTDGTHIFISDLNNSRIVKVLISSMAQIATIGTVGAGVGNFTAPAGLTNDGTHLYICDSGNNRVVKVQMAAMTWTSSSTGPGGSPFETPVDIAYDSSGPYLYLTETGTKMSLSVMDYSIGAGTFYNSWANIGSGAGQMQSPRGVTLDGSYAYVCARHSSTSKVMKFQMHAASAPTFHVELGSYGTEDDQYKNPQGIDYGSGVFYVADALNDRVKIILTDLSYKEHIGPTIEGGSLGTRTYAYVYVDEDGTVSGLSPTAEGTHADTISMTYGGFHSTDPKVSLIRSYGSYLDAPDELYMIEEFANNPAGTTWSKSETTADDDLGDLPYRTDKRLAVNGLPPSCRTGGMWNDILFTGGAVVAPDYAVGQITVDAAWSASYGLWRAVGTGTHFTNRMVGRYLCESTTPTEKYQIVWVDETNQRLYLCTEWTGTTASLIDYIISDERDPSVLYESVPGLYEDQPADYSINIGLGDGDGILAIHARGRRLYVFKQRSVWVVTGTNYQNYEAHIVSDTIGCDSMNSVIELPIPDGGSLLTFWSYPAVYMVSGTEEPSPISTFLDPLVREVSERAASRAVALLDDREGVVVYSMAKSPHLVNSENFALEYQGQKWSTEPGPRMQAAGYFQDVNGRRRSVFIDELGVIWQAGFGNADGLYDDDLTGALTGWGSDTLEVQATAATFSSDVVGVPIFLVKDDGTVETNVLVSTSGDKRKVYLLWKPDSVPDNSWQFILAGIERLIETGELDQGGIWFEKRFEDLWLEHERTAATLKVEAAEDQDNLEEVLELDLSLETPQSVPLCGPVTSFHGASIRFRFSSLLPGEDWTIRGFSYRASWRSERS